MRYRAGIIGTGGIAGMGILGVHDETDIGTKRFGASHAGGYGRADGIDLVAVADVDGNKLDRFGEAWSIPPAKRYVGHDARGRGPGCRLPLHADLPPSRPVVDAARSDAAPDVIWCEKPIASSVTEAQRMCEICAEVGTELVNHSFRFTTKLQRLRALVQERGILSDVRSVHGSFRRELLRNATHVLDTHVYLLDARAASVAEYLNGENDAVEALEGDRQVDDSCGGGWFVTDDGTFVINCTVTRDRSSMTFHLVGTGGKLYPNNDDGEWRYWELRDGAHVERPLEGIEGE